MRPERIAHRAGTEKKDAGIPEEILGGEVLGRSFLIGFFHELYNVTDVSVLRTHLNITITGFWPVRLDAEDHDTTGHGRVCAGFYSVPETAIRGNFVIGRNDEHQIIAMFAQRRLCCQHNGGSRVTSYRLENRSPARQVDAAKVSADALRMTF